MTKTGKTVVVIGFLLFGMFWMFGHPDCAHALLTFSFQEMPHTCR